MRVVVLTTGGWYGIAVLEHLRELGVSPAAVLVDVHRPSLGEAAKRPRSVLGTMRRQFAARPTGGRMIGNVNAPSGIAALRSANPDLLVVAGARVLSEAVLATAPHGALNAHPARLPEVRGRGVVAWSVLRGFPVEASVHLLAPTVDAGPVLDRRLIPVLETDTLEALERRAEETAARALAELTARIEAGERPEPERRTPGESILYRGLSPDDRERAATLVERGEAFRLFREASE